MSLSSLHDRLLEHYARLIDGLADPRRRVRTMLWLALGYGAAWWLYAVISKSSQGINADMGEMVVWARNLDWGYPKHPPLLGWILAGWFAVFPVADWAYHLLAALTLAAGLALSFLLAGEWLDGRKHAIAPFLLALIPFYNFIGLKFDQNSALIPIWALTAWASVRALDTRKESYAALAGAGAAAALLTKYWSAFFLFGLIVAALFDRRRRAYFRSSAPWISIAICGALIAPHVRWLVRNDFAPLQNDVVRRAPQSILDVLGSVTEYSLGTLGYCALALAVFAIYLRPSLAGLSDGAFPDQAARRRAALIFWVPLVAPIVLAVLLQANLALRSTIPALALLPVVLTASPLTKVTRDAASRIAATAVTATLLAVLFAPVVAATAFLLGENYTSYAPAVAARAESEWKATSTRRLAILAGPSALANSAAFYVKDRPSTYSDFLKSASPWITDDRIERDGAVIVCPVTNGYCGRNLDSLVARHRRGRWAEFTVVPKWLWLSGDPERFVIATLPPR